MKKTRQNKILNANIDLVIFDCDGVLVDSEVISCRAHAETLTRHGYPITRFLRFNGSCFVSSLVIVAAINVLTPTFYLSPYAATTLGTVLGFSANWGFSHYLIWPRHPERAAAAAAEPKRTRARWIAAQRRGTAFEIRKLSATGSARPDSSRLGTMGG